MKTNFKLFSGKLDDLFSKKRGSIKKEINDLGEIEILKRSINDEEIEKPTNRMIDADKFPESVRGSRDLKSGKLYEVKDITCRISFEGNPDLFYYKPSKKSTDWFAEAYFTIEGHLCFYITDYKNDPKEVKKEFDSMIGNLKKQINYINYEVKEYNETLREAITEILKNRKNKIKNDEEYFKKLK